MDAVIGFLEGLTIWHWIGLGIVLLAIEVAVGTFDLLWIAAGAFLTALFVLIEIGRASCRERVWRYV